MGTKPTSAGDDSKDNTWSRDERWLLQMLILDEVLEILS